MNIILGVTGSIAAYKANDVLRGLLKNGHTVVVVLTSGALKFVKAENFMYLGAEEVYSPMDDFNTTKQLDSVLHINLKDWADLILISPLSANTLAKFAHGECGDLLASIFLSAEAVPKILFPAMNTQMYNNTITKKNIEIVKSIQNLFFHEPDSGELICGDEGTGKLPQTDYIVDFVEHFSFKEVDKHVLITTGATIAPLDPVRYLTNPSSGKTGYELAKVYAKKGYNVTLIFGELASFPKNHLAKNPRIKLIPVRTTVDMETAVSKNFPKCDLYISSAAISDFNFEKVDQKIKKSDQYDSLKFSWSTDILAKCLKEKKHQKIISFAAETNNLDENFHSKWTRKPTDLMIGNEVDFGESLKGFGQDNNIYYFVREGEVKETMSLSKTELANVIYNYSQEL